MRRREQFLKQRGITPDDERESRADGDEGEPPAPPAKRPPSEESE